MRDGRKHAVAEKPSHRKDNASGPARGTDLRKRMGYWKDTIARETAERPGRSLALAVAAGYLVGGGVFSRLTARLVGLGLKIGLRMVAIPVVTQGLAMFGENLFRDGALDDVQNVGDVPDARPEIKKQLRHTEPKETQTP